jgi:putative hydrolase of the HAD superfamily
MDGGTPSRVIVFDLDDTLYLVRDFCRSGFAAVEQWLSLRHDAAGFARTALHLLDEGARGNVFNLALGALGIAGGEALIADLVAVYRAHEPAISLAPDAAALLAAPPAGCAFALLTDGPLAVQQRKIAALGLREMDVAPLVCTDGYGRAFWKPHDRAYAELERHFGVPGHHFAYVADNPAKDFIAPRRLGWNAVQICRPGRIHADCAVAQDGAPDRIIETLAELESALA